MRIVDACLRDGRGGSPTVVTDDETQPFTALPERYGTSHVVLLGRAGLRFFTRAGELPGCGHGTVAALAVLAGPASWTGTVNTGEHRVPAGPADWEGSVVIGGRRVPATVRPAGNDCVEAWFDQGPVTLRAAEHVDEFLEALGLSAGRAVIASPGRERLLIEVDDPAELSGLTPDHEHLAAVSRAHGQLGCFVHTPVRAGRVDARMFAPAIGVPEDVANANSSGCLAAHLLATGRDPVVRVDQGDALGRPSTVRASASSSGGRLFTRVGGLARVRA